MYNKHIYNWCYFIFPQVYKGLDVATNKATSEEMDGVPHHMMGTVDWRDECNVHQYRNEALKIVSFSRCYYYHYMNIILCCNYRVTCS